MATSSLARVQAGGRLASGRRPAGGGKRGAAVENSILRPTSPSLARPLLVRAAGRPAPLARRPARAAAAPSGDNGNGPGAQAPQDPSSLVMPRLNVTADTTIPTPPPLRVLRPPPPGTKKPRDANFWGKMSVLALAVRFF